MRTLKEIALELLHKYNNSELAVISHSAVNFRIEEKLLAEEVEKYKREIESFPSEEAFPISEAIREAIEE